jgi:hypothetical protein
MHRLCGERLRVFSQLTQNQQPTTFDFFSLLTQNQKLTTKNYSTVHARPPTLLAHGFLYAGDLGGSPVW